MNRDVIIACDFSSREATLEFLDRFPEGRKPVIANKMGGFSGRAIFPIALRMVYQVAHACRIPVMGCGGVASARDVVEMMMAGATAVQVGAENIRNPFACPEIVAELPALMDELGINTLQEIIRTV